MYLTKLTTEEKKYIIIKICSIYSPLLILLTLNNMDN